MDPMLDDGSVIIVGGTAWTFKAAATATADSVAMTFNPITGFSPNGEANDLCIAIIAGEEWTPGETPATGFTSAVKTGAGDPALQASYKKLTGSEGLITFDSGGEDSVGVFLLFSGVSTPSVQDAANEVSAAAPAAQTINASGSTVPALALAAYATSAATAPDPVDFDVAAVDVSDATHDVIGSGFPSLRVKRKLYLSAPADISVTMADEGASNAMISFYIREA